MGNRRGISWKRRSDVTPSTWIAARQLIQEHQEDFLRTVREKLGADPVTVYLDDDAIIMVYGDDVLVSTEDEPLLFVGERHLLDLSDQFKGGQ